MSEEKMVMQFKDPPPQRERRDWEAVAKKLRKKPGDWMLVLSGCKASTIMAIRQGSIRVLRSERGFEVRQANTMSATDGDVKRADLYLRYVPELDNNNEED